LIQTGILPHEIMELSPLEFLFDLQVLNGENKQIRNAKEKWRLEMLKKYGGGGL